MAAFVAVYGGPEYFSSSGIGYIGPIQSTGMGRPVNNVGTAVGWSLRNNLGVLAGTRALRWSALSNSAIELPHLGTDSGGRTTSIAHAINDEGTAVGYATKFLTDINKVSRAVRWSSSSPVAVELGLLGTANDSYATSEANDLNASGTAVGHASKYVLGLDYGWRAVRWDASGTDATELGHLGTSTRGDTFSVNDSGAAVGRCNSYLNGNSLGYRAVRWNSADTGVVELGNLGADNEGVTSSEAYAVDASGTAVGFATKYIAGTEYGPRAVRWESSASIATELGNLGTDSGGVTRSRAYDVNDSGTTVGYADKYVSGTLVGVRAVRWDGLVSNATELGNLGTNSDGNTSSQAYSVNNGGIAVGFAEKYVSTTLVGRRAVAWKSDSKAIDLNTLVDPASGWILEEAFGISDTGWISGVGRFDPDGPGGNSPYRRHFVMQIPEPNALLLAVVSLASGLALRLPRNVTRTIRPLRHSLRLRRSQ